MTEGTNDLRVLIVDDDFHVATLHAGYVDAVAGFVALPPVHDARRVAQAVAEQAPDLLLLDVYLPQGSGLDLLQGLDIDAFVLSAAADAPTVATAFRRGALAYLIKPFEPKVLTAKLRGYARYRRLLDVSGDLDQAGIDRSQRSLLVAEELAAVSSGAATEASVLAAVTDAGESTVMQVARVVGISRATAQRYLAQLTQSGALRLDLRYGSRGRPEHRYSRIG